MDQWAPHFKDLLLESLNFWRVSEIAHRKLMKMTILKAESWSLI